jgi:hypothetical protein
MCEATMALTPVDLLVLARAIELLEPQKETERDHLTDTRNHLGVSCHYELPAYC